MSYLTQREYQEVQAYSSFKPRQLSELENVIKQVIEVAKTPAVTDIHRRDKAVSIKEVTANLHMVTANASIIEVAVKVMNDPEQLPALLAKFPYVEFEKIINQGLVNNFQLAFDAGTHLQQLERAADWISSLLKVTSKLPLGKICFINTPDTCRKALSKHNKTNKGTYCEQFSPGDQVILDDLFSGSYHDTLKLILQFKLYGELPELKRRVRKDLATGITIDEKLYPFFIEYVKEPYMEFLSISTFTPDKKGSPQETCYKFVIPSFNL